VAYLHASQLGADCPQHKPWIGDCNGDASRITILFTFPFLVGLYESWMIPVPVLLSVPVRERSSARFRRLRSRPGETD
jgi:hypothetical protein